MSYSSAGEVLRWLEDDRAAARFLLGPLPGDAGAFRFVPWAAPPSGIPASTSRSTRADLSPVASRPRWVSSARSSGFGGTPAGGQAPAGPVHCYARRSCALKLPARGSHGHERRLSQPPWSPGWLAPPRRRRNTYIYPSIMIAPEGRPGRLPSDLPTGGGDKNHRARPDESNENKSGR